MQLKVQSPLVVSGKLVVGVGKQQWGPSLSDCLEIQASLPKKGLAVKGTWKCVSIAKRRRYIIIGVVSRQCGWNGCGGVELLVLTLDLPGEGP